VKHNIIFLDVDGVLNSRQYIEFCRRNGIEDSMSGSFCKIAVSNLHWILEQDPSVRIVISSTWRMSRSERISQFLKDADSTFPTEKIIGQTPKLDGVRGDEISAWLGDKNIQVHKIAIIDDDSDMAHLDKFLFQTTFKDGLTFSIAESITKHFLNYNLKFVDLREGVGYLAWDKSKSTLYYRVKDKLCYDRDGFEVEAFFYPNFSLFRIPE